MVTEQIGIGMYGWSESHVSIHQNRYLSESRQNNEQFITINEDGFDA